MSKNSFMRSSSRSALSSAARVFRALGLGEVPLVLQKAEVADDGGQRRLEVVREVDDEVILALFRVLGGAAGGEHVALYLVHLVLNVVQRGGEDHRPVAALVDLLRCPHHVAEVAQRLAPVDEEDDDVAADEENDHEERDVVPHRDEQPVYQPAVPGDGVADEHAEKERDKAAYREEHAGYDKAGQHAESQRPAVCGFLLLIQPDTPLPRRS